MYRISLFLSFTLFFVSPQTSANPIDSLLLKLDNAMMQRLDFQKEKEQRIAKINALLSETDLSNERIYKLNKKLIEEYEAYAFDSTLRYINRNLRLADAIDNQEFGDEMNIKLVELLSTSGRIEEAMDMLNAIKKEELPGRLLLPYYQAYRKLYSELFFYGQVQRNMAKYQKLRSAYIDSALLLVEPESDAYLEIKENQLLDLRQLMECRKVNSKRLAMANMGTRAYSMATFRRSQTYELEGDVIKQKEYLILSAISDIKAAVKDNASLTVLALLLFKEGEVDRAHRYISFALEDAVFYNSRLRFVEISNILPLITTAHEIESEQQKSKLRNSLILISLLSVVLLLAFVSIFRQVKKVSKARNDLSFANQKLNNLNAELQIANGQLNGLNSKLAESNHVKEHYIGNFLNICSNYIEKLDDYRKRTNKMIAARKVQELFDQTKSQQLIEEELREFYKTFDDTFLHIYPNFVNRVNEMLEKDEQIVLKDDERLNTELRIFALIRLGITDSSKIAQLLHYSVNTIYNYRAKVKNRAAVPRDDFEKMIMEIGA